MKKLFSLLLCIVMLMTTLVSVSAETAKAVKPAITIGVSSDLPSNAPYGNSSTVTAMTTNSTFNGLVTVNRDGTATGELATSWTSNEDSTEWTFKLREGVKFHDGSDFTANDVKFTWEYASSSENDGIKWVIIGYDKINEIVVEDDYTVTFKLNCNAPDWLTYAAQKIMSEKAVKENGADGCKIGTGPYVFEAQDPGVSWSIVRNDAYWGELPPTEKITFSVITDASTRALALKSGDVDAIYGANSSDIVEFMADKSYNVYQFDNLANVYMGYNMNRQLGENEALRKAIAMAINRDDIVAACYEGGACAKPSYNFINDVSVGYTEVKNIPYDPEGAKALLDENGIKDVTLVLYTFAMFIPVAEIIQANLSMIGINVDIREQAQSGFTANLRSDGQYDLFINKTSSTGGLLNILSRFFKTGSTVSCMFYANEEFDAKLAEAEACKTYDEMLAAYADLQQYIADNGPEVPLVQTYLWTIGTDKYFGADLGNQEYDVDFSYAYVLE